MAALAQVVIIGHECDQRTVQFRLPCAKTTCELCSDGCPTASVCLECAGIRDIRGNGYGRAGAGWEELRRIRYNEVESMLFLDQRFEPVNQKVYWRNWETNQVIHGWELPLNQVDPDDLWVFCVEGSEKVTYRIAIWGTNNRRPLPAFRD